MHATPVDPSALPASLVLVGAGKMGGAMLDGWLGAGLPARAVTILDPHADARPGIALNPPIASLARPDMLVLAVKPQTLDAAAAGFAGLAGPDTLVLSIMAGKTTRDLARACPDATAFVRAMPNLPASIGQGATGAYASPDVSPRQRAAATALLGANGLVEWVESEDLIDAVTAMSGSGPAYLFHLCECLAEAGVTAGLDEVVSARLARATVTGAAALLARSDLTPAELRRNVTSPGGTTAAALAILGGEPGLRALLTDAVLAARRRAGELAG